MIVPNVPNLGFLADLLPAHLQTCPIKEGQTDCFAETKGRASDRFKDQQLSTYVGAGAFTRCGGQCSLLGEVPHAFDSSGPLVRFKALPITCGKNNLSDSLAFVWSFLW